MRRHPFLNLTSGILLAVFTLPDLTAAVVEIEKPDTVIVRSERNEGTRRLRGTITRWEGSALTLASGNRQRQIDNNAIVDVETAWSKTAVEARQQLSAGAFPRATMLLRQSITDETRLWAQEMLRADLVRALLAMEQPAAACEQFLVLLRRDPNTRFLNVMPLAWTARLDEASLVSRAGNWLSSEVPIVRLMGASYLIGTAQQEESLQILEALSQDLDPRVSGLAAAQIWRAQPDVDIRLIEQWRQLLSAMPKSLRPGPLFVLAGHFESAGRHDEAITTWMRLPILHEDRPDLAAAALYRVARLMHNTSSQESANDIHQELTRRFPDASWTQRANQLK